MNKISLFICFMFGTMVLFLSSCQESKINGSNIYTSIRQDVGYVNGIVTRADIDIVLVNDVSNYISIEAEDNIISEISAINQDGLLNISYKHDIGSNHNKVTVYIPVQQFNYLAVEGSGSVTAQDSFKCAERVLIELSGSGNINLPIYAEFISNVIDGSGNIKLSGKVHTAYYKVNGSGSINALDVNEDIVHVNSYGTGDVLMNANEILIVKIFGSGNVKYKNAPGDFLLEITGTGECIEIQ